MFKDKDPGPEYKDENSGQKSKKKSRTNVLSVTFVQDFYLFNPKKNI